MVYLLIKHDSTFTLTTIFSFCFFSSQLSRILIICDVIFATYNHSKILNIRSIKNNVFYDGNEIFVDNSQG